MEMLKEIITRNISLTTNELDFMLSLFKPIILEKESHFLEIGKRCNQVAFVKSGLLRIYNINDNGEESTTFFSLPNTFVTSHESLNEQTPTKEGIQAVLKTELLVITKENLNRLYKEIPSTQELGRKTVEQIVSELHKRITLFLNHSAEKRYDILMQNFPVLIQNVPLKFLASYIGITPQHMSRLRKTHL